MPGEGVTKLRGNSYIDDAREWLKKVVRKTIRRNKIKLLTMLVVLLVGMSCLGAHIFRTSTEAANRDSLGSQIEDHFASDMEKDSVFASTPENDIPRFNFTAF